MHKFLLLLAIFFYASTLFAGQEVKIGVYKNTKKLHANIAKIKSSKYRKHIVVKRKNNLNYVYAVIGNNVEAKRALHMYKRVFKDAFIAKKQGRVKKTVKKVSPSLLKNARVKEKLANLNAKALLENKTIYMCYEKGPKHLKERVVKMVFEKEHVIYDPLKNMSTPVNMPYEFKKNKLTLELSGMKITHKISKKTENYLYAQSVVNGLIVNKLRYYFDKNTALEFVSRH